MQNFFSSIADIEQYSSWMNRQYKLACQHCDKVGYLIGHGFVYRQVTCRHREVVGKRLVCSRRHNNRGCGRTIQLRLAVQLPKRRYQAMTLGIFIFLLLTQHSVTKAYQQATKQFSTRHAWRWLKALKQNLWRYRQFLLPNPHQQPEHLKHKHPLFLTLYQYQAEDKAQICLRFHLAHQLAFI